VEVAEEADGLAIGPERHQNVGSSRFRDAFGLYLRSGIVVRLEEAAVERDVVVVLASEDCIGLGAGCDENGFGWKRDVFARCNELTGGIVPFVFLETEGCG